MNVVFRAESWRNCLGWQDDPRAFAKLNDLILECCRNPFRGTGKPEPLKQNLTGWRSRRINQEHRLIYRVRGAADERLLQVLHCRHLT